MSPGVTVRAGLGVTVRAGLGMRLQRGDPWSGSETVLSLGSQLALSGAPLYS